MLKKILLLPALTLLFTGCDIDYDGSTKIVFEGYVTDTAGQPLEGIPMGTYVNNDNDFDVIGLDKTDSNGYYRMIFPYPKNTSGALLVNRTEDVTANNPYSKLSLENIDMDDDVNGYTINFGTIQIFKLENTTTLNIAYDGMIEFEIKKIRLSGLIDNNSIDYNYSIDMEDQNSYSQYLTYNEFTVAQNQVITLEYTLYDGSMHTEQIAIGTEPVTYTIQ